MKPLFLGLFLFFLFITRPSLFRRWPVSLFLEATPLIAVATALERPTTIYLQAWYGGLVIIAITMMVGRVWCNWMCPFGILHHFFERIGNRRNTKQMIEVNRCRQDLRVIVYYILAVMISRWLAFGSFLRPSTHRARSGRPYQGAELRQTGMSRIVAAIRDRVSPDWLKSSKAKQQLTAKSASWTRSPLRSSFDDNQSSFLPCTRRNR